MRLLKLSFLYIAILNDLIKIKILKVLFWEGEGVPNKVYSVHASDNVDNLNELPVQSNLK